MPQAAKTMARGLVSHIAASGAGKASTLAAKAQALRGGKTSALFGKKELQPVHNFATAMGTKHGLSTPESHRALAVAARAGKMQANKVMQKAAEIYARNKG